MRAKSHCLASVLGTGRAAREDLGEADDRVERRAQLVTHRRQELVPGAERRFNRAFRLLDLALRSAALGDVGEDRHDVAAVVVDDLWREEEAVADPHLDVAVVRLGGFAVTLSGLHAHAKRARRADVAMCRRVDHPQKGRTVGDVNVIE